MLRVGQSSKRAHSAAASRLSRYASTSAGSKPRLILGIESSCDDSCAAVVTSDRRILSSIVTKQDHSSTSGIHPLLAARAHHASIPATIATSLSTASITIDQVDAIAVTLGPGMASSLGVGLSAAKTLAAVHSKPLIYVHHMVAHALTPLLTEKEPPSFPFLVLLVSGGHSLLVMAKSVSSFEILASTTDEAIGDVFDKVARELGLPWASAPGALLETFATQYTKGSDTHLVFPVPDKGKPSFSFSGIKTAVMRHIQTAQEAGPLSDSQRAEIASVFQSTAFAQLEDKIAMVLRPIDQLRKDPRKSFPRITPKDGTSTDNITTLVCSGGVASNKFLRKRLRACLDDIGRPDVQLSFPPLSLCTDNAAMIAWAGQLLYDTERTTDLTQHARSKWSIEQLLHT